MRDGVNTSKGVNHPSLPLCPSTPFPYTLSAMLFSSVAISGKRWLESSRSDNGPHVHKPLFFSQTCTFLQLLSWERKQEKETHQVIKALALPWKLKEWPFALFCLSSMSLSSSSCWADCCLASFLTWVFHSLSKAAKAQCIVLVITPLWVIAAAVCPMLFPPLSAFAEQTPPSRNKSGRAVFFFSFALCVRAFLSYR